MTTETHQDKPDLKTPEEAMNWCQYIMSLHRGENMSTSDSNLMREMYDSASEMDPPGEMDSIYRYRNMSAECIGDGLFVCPVMNFAEKYSAKTNTYLIFWERIRETECWPGESWDGPYHGLMFYTSIASQFLILGGEMSQRDAEYARNSAKMVTGFAKNPHGTPQFNKTKLARYSVGGMVNRFTADGLTFQQPHSRKEICDVVWGSLQTCPK